MDGCHGARQATLKVRICLPEMLWWWRSENEREHDSGTDDELGVYTCSIQRTYLIASA